MTCALVSLTACPEPLVTPAGEGAPTKLQVFLAGLPVARVEERRRGAVVERESQLALAPDDAAHLRVELDRRGFVTRARYERRGPGGDREVTIVHEGRTTTLTTSRGAYVISRDRPLVLLETLHHLDLSAAADVVFVDPTTGEALLGRVAPDGEGVVARDRHGSRLARATRQPVVREGPGRFIERGGDAPRARPTLHPPMADFPGASRRVRLLGLEGLSPAALSLDTTGQRLEEGLVVRFDRAYVDTTPPDDEDARPAPFLESDDEGVRAFAARHASGDVPSADALALASAIHEWLDTGGGGGPPSAVRTLSTRAGDCDDATALLVAALRSLGHPARPVVGYRHHRGRLVPHAWAEVHDGRGWLPVDALVPGLGPFETHLKLFEGLGSSLTMGRVLGALQVEPVVGETDPPPPR